MKHLLMTFIFINSIFGTENKLSDYFWNKEKTFPIHKWHHYFEIYDRHFKKYHDTSPVILEIGVFKGGSLEMWNYYFDKKCQIYGVDIDPECKKFESSFDNVTIFIGDQADPNFWAMVKNSIPKIDILVDDGGHTMTQQIVTFESMYNHLSDDGVYLCEDLHTSYWPEYGGGSQKRLSFINYSKNFIDMINAYHTRKNSDLNFRKTTHSIHYYDSVVVLERRRDDNPPTDSLRQ